MRPEGYDALLRRKEVMLQTACKLLAPAFQAAPDTAEEVAAELARVSEPAEVYAKSSEAGHFYRAAAYLRMADFRIADRDDPVEADRSLRQALLLTAALQSEPELVKVHGEIRSLRGEQGWSLSVAGS